MGQPASSCVLVGSFTTAFGVTMNPCPISLLFNDCLAQCNLMSFPWDGLCFPGVDAKVPATEQSQVLTHTSAQALCRGRGSSEP